MGRYFIFESRHFTLYVPRGSLVAGTRVGLQTTVGGALYGYSCLGGVERTNKWDLGGT